MVRYIEQNGDRNNRRIDTVDAQIQLTDRHSIQIDTADRQTQMDRYSRRIDIVDRQIKQMDRYRQKQSRQIDTVDGQIQTEIEQTEIGRPDACFFVAAIFSFSCQKFKLRKNLMTAHGRSKAKNYLRTVRPDGEITFSTLDHLQQEKVAQIHNNFAKVG